jgi:hypothetical protein
MEYHACGVKDKRSIRLDSGIEPSPIAFPFHKKHPIGENPAERELRFITHPGLLVLFGKW